MTLNGKRIFLMVSEPWEFGTEHGCGPFEAKVVSESDSDLLVQLSNPLRFEDTDCEYFVAQPRYDESLQVKLQDEGCIVVGFTRVSAEIALGSDPFDLSSWRGGVALIGSLHLNKPKSK